MTDTTPTADAVCLGCGKALKPQLGDVSTNYQFDGALWLGFHGGYGMFVDNVEAMIPLNADERWLIEDGKAVDNPNYQPIFEEERMLSGSDHEAVICHECAHELCEAFPWIKKLLDPDHSHACTL